MRNAELINLIVLAYYGVLAWSLQLPRQKRIRLTVACVLGMTAMLASPHLPFDESVSSVVRDWLPVPMMLLAYSQSGAFYVRANTGLQRMLERSDRWVSAVTRQRGPAAKVGLEFLEACYMLCYPMVPMGLAGIYVLRLAEHADRYWTVVLTSAYLCYAAVPWLQSMPPRAEEIKPDERTGPIRRFNLWILDRASIHANTFPSAHAAAACAAAFVSGSLSPVLGIVFGILAAGICLGAITGRYHYTLDVLLGAAVAAVCWIILQ